MQIQMKKSREKKKQKPLSESFNKNIKMSKVDDNEIILIQQKENTF